MRVFIFSQYQSFSSGVGIKLYSQLNALCKSGIESRLIFCSSLNEVVFNQSNTRVCYCTHSDKLAKSLIGPVYRNIIYAYSLKMLINSLGEGDVIYIRALSPNPFFLWALRSSRNCLIVSEFQTIEPNEKKMSRKFSFYLLLDALFGGPLRKSLNGIVGVTEEITDYQKRRSKNERMPVITIGNGIDVLSLPERKLLKYNGDFLNLLCVANFNHWHGLDRFLRGLATYSGRPRIVLHIAGDGAELPHLQKQANDLGISNQVVFHGFLSGEAFDALFDQCHIAVGSLGIHRLGLKEASILKAREYCARGIPFIYGIHDPDFPADFPYILHLPADESPVDIKQILAFAKRVYADPDHPQKMRRYAKERLDWSVKMRELKDFLETMAGNL